MSQAGAIDDEIIVKFLCVTKSLCCRDPEWFIQDVIVTSKNLFTSLSNSSFDAPSSFSLSHSMSSISQQRLSSLVGTKTFLSALCSLEFSALN